MPSCDKVESNIGEDLTIIVYRRVRELQISGNAQLICHGTFLFLALTSERSQLSDQDAGSANTKIGTHIKGQADLQAVMI